VKHVERFWLQIPFSDESFRNSLHELFCVFASGSEGTEYEHEGEVMVNRTLNPGHSGPDVHATQQALNTWGAAPPLRPDGVFGPNTETAVRRF
jgi:peptidoglycan hydrolase-like protein with peptidoglycan-binding domain